MTSQEIKEVQDGGRVMEYLERPLWEIALQLALKNERENERNSPGDYTDHSDAAGLTKEWQHCWKGLAELREMIDKLERTAPPPKTTAHPEKPKPGSQDPLPEGHK